MCGPLTKVVHRRRALGGGYMGGCHTKWIMDIGGGHVGYAKISKNQKYKKNYRFPSSSPGIKSVR